MEVMGMTGLAMKKLIQCDFSKVLAMGSPQQCHAYILNLLNNPYLSSTLRLKLFRLYLDFFLITKFWLQPLSPELPSHRDCPGTKDVIDCFIELF